MSLGTDPAHQKRNKPDAVRLQALYNTQIMLRLLCESKEVGAILGRTGATVRELRLQSGATIDVSRAQRSDISRIVTLDGTGHCVMSALLLIIDKLFEARVAAQQHHQLLQHAMSSPSLEFLEPPSYEQPSSSSSLGSISSTTTFASVASIVSHSSEQSPSSSTLTPASSQNSTSTLSESPPPCPPPILDREVLIVLLVPNVQLGYIIGKGGSTIRVTREDSGAHVRVSDELMENSTENTLSIRGSLDAVKRAASIIVEQLLETHDKVVHHPAVLYQPVVPVTPMNPVMSHYLAYGQPFIVDPYTGFATPWTLQPPMPPETIVIYVPESVVGSLIGKRGASINDIRQRSGSQIKIGDPMPNAQDRQVTITGPPPANELALAMVYDRINSWEGSATGLEHI